MLENLHEINWAELNHAYGSAADVPESIKQLIHGSEDIRGKAYYKLYSNIFHQGSRYSATPHALAFLSKIFENKQSPERSKVLSLLTSLAIGYDELYCPTGINTTQLKELHKAYKIKKEDVRFQWGNLLYLSDENSYACYLAVNDMIPNLVNYMLDEDEEVQRKLIFLFAWFPDHVDMTVPVLKKRLISLSNEADIMNTILCLGLLRTSANQSIQIPELKPYLNHSAILVRICAAIAMSKSPIEAELMEPLIQAATLDGWEIRRFENCVFHNDGDIVGYAFSVLQIFGESQLPEIVDRICELLKTTNDSETSFHISKFLIAFTGHRNDLLTLPLTELGPIDAKILEAIAQYGKWESDERVIRYSLAAIRSYIKQD